MNMISFRSWCMSIAFLGTSLNAFAQTPVATATPFEDPHPYQTEVTFFAPGTDAMSSNLYMSFATTPYTDFGYKKPGDQVDTVVAKAGRLYDRRSSQPPVKSLGLNYTIYSDGKMNYLSTLDANGFYFNDNQTTFEAKVVGGVYFVNKSSNTIVMVDSWGYIWNSPTIAPEIKVAGGNYFIDADGVLTTFKSMGNGLSDATGMMTTWNAKADAAKGWTADRNFSSVTAVGGNFIGIPADASDTNKSDKIVTISSKTGLYSQPYIPDATPKILGGNFYIGTDGVMYTVDADGNLKKQNALPIKTISVIGYSFVRFTDGSFVFVDGNGDCYTSVLHWTSNKRGIEELSTLPSSIDKKTLYLPKAL